MSKYNVSVTYKGGAGVSFSRNTMRDVMDRLGSIERLADSGSVIISRINITTEEWVGPRVEDEPSLGAALDLVANLREIGPRSEWHDTEAWAEAIEKVIT